MPKAKTTKKTTTTKKTVALKKDTSKKATSFSLSNFKVMTLSDIRNTVTNPKNRRSLILSSAIIIVAIVLFLGRGLLIAATVNGQPVSRLAIISELEKQSGKAVLDSVVTKMLVVQEAKKKNVEASSKDIDAEIAKIKKQFKDQGQDLDSLLASQGLTQEKFRDEVKIQILVTKLLGDKAKVTDKEFKDFMDKNKDIVPAGEDQKTAEANLRTQLEQQKLAQQYQSWIQNVKKDAAIQYFVNY